MSKVDKVSLVSVDLTDPQYGTTKVFEVNVPENIVRNENVRIYIQNPLVNLQLRSDNLYTLTYLDAVGKGDGDTYANVKIEETNNDYSGHILRYVPRGKRVVGEVGSVEVTAINNLTQTKMTTFNGTILMGMPYDANLGELSDINSMKIYHYDPTLSDWIALNDSWLDKTSGYIYANVNEPGHYVILGDR